MTQIGIDAVSIPRIQRILARFGEKFLQRILGSEEIFLAQNPRTIAGFFAAKEATAKALKTGIGARLGFRDIMIYKKTAAPEIKIRKNHEFSRAALSLSITHEKNLAIAVVLAVLPA